MFLLSSLPALLCMLIASSSETKISEEALKTCSAITCAIPGRDGRDGPKGEKGEPGTGWAALAAQIFTPSRRLFPVRALAET